MLAGEKNKPSGIIPGGFRILPSLILSDKKSRQDDTGRRQIICRSSVSEGRRSRRRGELRP